MRAFALIVVAFPAPCFAAWTATILHPPTATQSVGLGSGPGVQTGDYTVGADHAALWTGTAGTLVDLHPTGIGAGASQAFAAAGSQQVGVVTVGFTDKAALWTGTSASYVDLSPIGVSAAHAYGTDGANQAGDITVGPSHAAYWSGTPASFVDLNPAVADASTARAVHAGEVAGFAVISSEMHAAYWVKLAGVFGFTDLHPAGAGNSIATSIVPGMQGGFVTPVASPHAAIWTGTAESWVDLNPASAGSSEILGMDMGVQTGYASIGGTLHAGAWFGTAASFVDLQSFLPAGYSNSQGRAVYFDGAGLVQVVGYADHLTDTGTRIEAIVWTTTVPEPASVVTLALIVSRIATRRTRR